MEMNQSPYLRLIQCTGSTRHPGGFIATDMLLKKALITEDSTILDVGCGAGHTAAHIAKTYGCRVVGIDISEKAIEKAQDFYSREPYFKLLSFFVGDVTHLDFENKVFDVVLCESVLIFVEDKQAAIKEMKRVTKNDGFLIINELCQSGKEESAHTKSYFSRPEMGGFLEPAQLYLDCLHDWRLIIMDEKPFDFAAQLKADWQQWGNFKGLIHILEAGFHIATDKQLQKDLLAVFMLLKDTPRNILGHLNHLMLMAQKSKIKK